MGHLFSTELPPILNSQSNVVEDTGGVTLLLGGPPILTLEDRPSTQEAAQEQLEEEEEDAEEGPKVQPNLTISYPYRTTRKGRIKKRRRCCFKRGRSDVDNTTLLREFSKQNSRSSGGGGGGSFYSSGGGARDREPTIMIESFSTESLRGAASDDPTKLLHVPVRAPQSPRRTRIPDRPDISMSLWSLVKNAIGKDLTKLPLPVNFNEPLSMLQRLTEDFEYASLLDRAAAGGLGGVEQLALIAAFTVSSYATSSVRTGKPFNPILGETYECDRGDDLGWRSISEQVSHHPPIAAQYCQGRRWVLYQQFSMSSKFRGNSIEIIPLGIAHLVFPSTGAHYTWRKVPSVVHNIMIGKLWIEQDGEMDIFNHTSGESAHISYIPSTFFRGDYKRVEGTVYGKDKVPRLSLSGHWDREMESAEIVKVDSGGAYTLGPPNLLWARVAPPPDSDRYYNFTLLASQLNEMEEGVAPTDSRNRPDQRLMENGLFDEANLEKLRLEEKQRAERKVRLLTHTTPTPKSKSKTSTSITDQVDEPNYSPAWFSLQHDQITGKMAFTYNGDYWEAKKRGEWGRCPNIF